MSDRQQLNGSRDPHLLEFCLCVTPSLWVWAGPRVSRLTECGKNDEMSRLRWGCKKTVAFFLGKDLALSPGLLWEKLPATWDMSYGQEQKGAFNQQPANDKSQLGGRSFLGRVNPGIVDCLPAISGATLSQMCPGSWRTATVCHWINVHCFKPLRGEQITQWIINNESSHL